MSKHDCLGPLTRAGIEYDDAVTLRRISMTLHRWHEGECGDSNDYASWCIVRGRRDGGTFIHEEGGASYMQRQSHTESTARYERIRDLEAGALRRLKAIMARYPTMSSYVQGDPRGAARYILRPGDVPEGASVDSCYSRGIAVYK